MHHLQSLKTALVCLFLINGCFCFAQFTDVSDENNIAVGGIEGMYGNGVSLYDFNKDGLDDLTFCTNGDGVHTYINAGDQFTETNLIEPIQGDIKQANWVDFDNDGDADFFCTIYGGSCKLFRNENNGVFLNVTDSLYLPTTTGMSFGAAWADYDRDGFLDVYVANYDFILPAATTNWLFHNNGMGAFEEVAFMLGADNGYRATFQPSWIDLDNDLYPDLYVINDKYHGNTFYHNTVSGFIDLSEELELDMEMEAMSNSWSDFDNDLDFDVYISNTTQGNKLMRNDEDHFTDIAVEAGVEVNSVCWSALWIDYDHNGQEDLHVATNSQMVNNNANILFRQEDADSFYESSIQGDNAGVLASAMGDINQDGYIDFVEMEQYPLGISMFQNDGGANHWLKISLEGVVSNRDGVGATISFFINGEHLIRPTFCGEGFLTQNSQYEILSCGNSSMVDSLFIQWPSGWMDKFYNISSDQLLEIIEGETFSADILNVSEKELCPGDSVLLFADCNGQLTWNDGSQQPYFSVHDPGVYEIMVLNEFGLTTSASIDVVQYELPAIEWLSTHPACADSSDGSIALNISTDLVSQIEWDGVEGNYSQENLPAGIYFFEMTDVNGCIQTGEIQLIEPLPLSVEIFNQTICPGEFAEVVVDVYGGTGSCTIDWMDLDQNTVPVGSYVLTAHDENNCTASVEFEIENYPPLNVEAFITNPISGFDGSIDLDVSGGLPPYDCVWNFKDHSLDLLNLFPGIYNCLITDAAGCQTTYSAELIGLTLENDVDEALFYPNPFHDVLVIQMNDQSPFFIYDSLGKLV